MVKKGQSTLYYGLGAVVSVAVILLIYLAFLRDVSIVSQSASINERCKKSVQLYCSAQVSDKSFFDSVDCQTQYETISNDLDDAQIKMNLANAMYHCWDNMGRGQCELFPTPQEKQCIVCHVLNFEGEGREVKGLIPYMVDNKAPFSEETYYEFITNERLSAQDKGAASSSPDVINTKESYAVVFGIFKKNWITKFQAQTSSGVAAGTTGAIGTGLVISYFIPGMNIVTLAGTAIVGGVMIGAGAYYGAGKVYETDYDADVVIIPYKDLYTFGCDEMRGKQYKE